MQIFERSLIVIGHSNDELTVYGKSGYIERIKQNNVEFVDRKCRYFGSDLNTAKLCFKDKISVRKNSPICVCATRKILLFKINCSVTNQPIWFRYSPNMNYKKIDVDKYGIFYDKEFLIIASFSKHKYNTQINRIKEFIDFCVVCSNCTKLSCAGCR